MNRPSVAEERKVLSRELSVFLVQFSIALHKNTTYPEGHPLLASAVDAVTLRLNTLLHERSALLIGIARNQLLIEGSATDPANPVLRELAQRLHRQQIGAVKFAQGTSREELADLLRTVGNDSQRGGQPLGLQPPEELQRWSHIRLFPQAYDQLELVGDLAERRPGDFGSETKAARLWVGLAAAALAQNPDQVSTATEAGEVAKAINSQKRDVTYDQAIVGYLLQLGQELKLSQGAEAIALRQRLSDLLRTLNQDTMRHLLELGGNLSQRRQLVSDVAESMPVGAVVELVRAASEASEQTLPHSLLRLLTKLAAHAERGGPTIRTDADAALRDTVKQLIDGWSLEDPNPSSYTSLLEKLARPPSIPSPPDQAAASEAPRIVQMALEIGAGGETVWHAVDEMVDQGLVSQLLELLDQPGTAQLQIEAFWFHLATPACVRRLLMDEAKDAEAVERVVSRMGLGAAEPMLEALEVADSRATRRRLLTRLGRLGPAIGPMIVERLPGSPWFVQRNMLALLSTMSEWPRNFSPAPYAEHADPRVRREALKMMLRLPAMRDEAVCSALADVDAQVVRMALGAALEACPSAAVPRLIALGGSRSLDPELRAMSIRALGSIKTISVRDWLMQQVLTPPRWFRGRKLMSKSPELLAALAALGRSWKTDAAASEALRQAAQSTDPEIRAAASSAPISPRARP